ncbi:uncharacterized protein K452DRAFT_288612 [Aplosporella prunicola CBS 121167]|uniref:Basic proline-rich protein n=1 Tax=Aplosporella prunicola CBS 121167 TaxID=1176127 RepID=A0A6A6BB01_9PEZI|nr:uncharacterized protein K452DRAFT_288612 [Aplosporella prunicola CBS 121167]KAF2140533.1 hypothetical protein K452DRAFT_288612 [Aplosporella prunicola CBS 121167]
MNACSDAADAPASSDRRISTSPPTSPAENTDMKKLSLEDMDHVDELPAAAATPMHPETPRRLTDPTLSALLQPQQSPMPRNRSPYTRNHLRSSSLNVPVMTRAHSSPTVIGPSGHLTFASVPRPSSPMRSPARVRGPPKLSGDEPYPHPSNSSASDIGSISEDRELNFVPRSTTDRVAENLSSFSHYAGNTFPRQRRRPTSPLYHPSNAPFGYSSAPSTPSHASPPLPSAKFNESFPQNISYPSSFSSSSVPSTPTSIRSRSPSISSLETIPDTPDAEEAAIEADRIAKLEAAAKAAEGGNDGMRRSSLDVPRVRNAGFGAGSRDKRKRWSVCGAEKRGDLDLETIWED